MACYDLSQPVADGMAVYPGDPSVDVSALATIDADGYRQTALDIATHTGTHVDAPAHFIDGGRCIDEFPVETFRFTARRLDCTGLEPRAEIGRETLSERLAADRLATVDLLVVQTGWDDYWDCERYFDHPFLTPAAAEWLVDRGLHLGIDAPNVDPTPTDSQPSGDPVGYPVHRQLLGAGRLLIENLCGLERLPRRFELHAYPLAVEGGDGAPVRAVGIAEL